MTPPHDLSPDLPCVAYVTGAACNNCLLRTLFRVALLLPAAKKTSLLCESSHRSLFCEGPAAGFFTAIITDSAEHHKYTMRDKLSFIEAGSLN